MAHQNPNVSTSEQTPTFKPSNISFCGGSKRNCATPRPTSFSLNNTTYRGFHIPPAGDNTSRIARKFVPLLGTGRRVGLKHRR